MKITGLLIKRGKNTFHVNERGDLEVVAGSAGAILNDRTCKAVLAYAERVAAKLERIQP